MVESVVPGGVHEVQRLAGVLVLGAQELVGAPVWSLSVPERVQALVEVETAARAVEAARLGLVRSLEGQDLSVVGEASLAGLLGARCRTGPGRARADIDAARATDPHTGTAPGSRADGRGALTAMGQALAQGSISRAHLDVAVRVLDKVPTAMRAQAGPVLDQFLVQVSRAHPPRECQSLAAVLLDRLDPDRTDPAFDPHAYARSRLDLVTDSTGMLVLSGQLDPMTGAQLRTAIEHFRRTPPRQHQPRQHPPRRPGHRPGRTQPLPTPRRRHRAHLHPGPDRRRDHRRRTTTDRGPHHHRPASGPGPRHHPRPTHRRRTGSDHPQRVHHTHHPGTLRLLSGVRTRPDRTHRRRLNLARTTRLATPAQRRA